jgi:hypothetical protein
MDVSVQLPNVFFLLVCLFFIMRKLHTELPILCPPLPEKSRCRISLHIDQGRVIELARDRFLSWLVLYIYHIAGFITRNNELYLSHITFSQISDVLKFVFASDIRDSEFRGV